MEQTATTRRERGRRGNEDAEFTEKDLLLSAPSASSIPRFPRSLFILAAWTLVAVTFAFLSYIDGLASAEPMEWWKPLLLNLARFAPWAAFTPLIIALARRYPFDRRQDFPRYLAIYLPLGVLLAAVHFLGYGAVLRLLDPWIRDNYSSLLDLYRRLFVRSLPNNLLIYLLTVAAIQAGFYYRRFRREERDAARLRTQLAEAQLKALKMQLHPHFLFNTLHAISALMDEDIKAARRMIARLSELLRLTLDGSGAQEVSLGRELEILERYLEIERIRFQDRLRVEMSIDPETLAARVPNLILQPLLENAIRHGIAPVSTAGRIEIEARRRDAMVWLSVRDDGPGLPAQSAGELKEGIGLANTRARLRQIYGEEHRFEIGNAEGGGLRVTIGLPFQPIGSESEDEPDGNHSHADRR